MKKHIWNENELAILKANYAEKGAIGCQTLLNRSIISISLKANKMGLKYIYKYITPIKMERLKTPEFAYLLGYLWADGYVYQKGGTVTLNIDLNDALNIKNIIEYTGEWKFNIRERYGKNYAEIRVTDRAFLDFLLSMDYATKSVSNFRKIKDKLGEGLFEYFIHGFFDGDGSIHGVDKDSANLSVSGNINYDWGFFINILRSHGIKSSLRKSVNKKQQSGSIVNIRAAIDILRFYKKFILGHKFGLNRKRERFENLIKKYKDKYLSRRKITFINNSYHVKAKLGNKTFYIGTFPSKELSYRAMDEFDAKHQTRRYLIKKELIEMGVSD